MKPFAKLPYCLVVKNIAEQHKEIELLHAAKYLNHPGTKWQQDGSLQSEDDAVTVRSNTPGVTYREIVYASSEGWTIGLIRAVINKCAAGNDSFKTIPARIFTRDARGVTVTIPFQLAKDEALQQDHILTKEITFRIDLMTGIFITVPPETEIALQLVPGVIKMPRLSLWQRLKRFLHWFFNRRPAYRPTSGQVHRKSY